MIMKAGIIIDEWKLAIFTRVLDEGGYTFEQLPGIVKGTISLKVEIEDTEVEKIKDIVAVANNRAAKSKSKRWS